MTAENGGNLAEALIQLGRDQGQMLALYKGEDWEGMLKEMLTITKNKKTRREIRDVLGQVEKAVIAIRGR